MKTAFCLAALLCMASPACGSWELLPAVAPDARQFSPEEDFAVQLIEDGSAVVITDYTGTGTEVRIPPRIQGLPVAGIGNGAFEARRWEFRARWVVSERRQITSVTIPDGVTFIGGRAFADNLLASVAIPDSVAYIGTSAFMNNRLASVAIPASASYIGEGAFMGNHLTSVHIPDGVTYVGGFSGNRLGSVAIPASVTHIGPSAFAGTQLTSVAIPDGVTHIGPSAFAGNRITSVAIPGSVRHVGTRAFADNPLGSLSIQSSATQIEGLAFYGSQIAALAIGDSAMRIGDMAFEGAAALDRFAHIGNQLFRVTQEFEAEGGFTARFIVNGGAAAVEITGRVGTDAELRIPSRIRGMPVAVIGDMAFVGGRWTVRGFYLGHRITSVAIPNSVIRIGNLAFADNHLTAIEIPDSVTHIGQNAFARNWLRSLAIPDSVTHIGQGAFLYNQIAPFDIPDSVRHSGAFDWDRP